MTRQKRSRKWLSGIALVILLSLASFIASVLNPGWFYRHKTKVGTHRVYSDRPLDPSFQARLQQAIILTDQSTLKDSTFAMEICIGGSVYVAIVQRLFGDAFAWGFYNKVVIHGKVNSAANRHESGWNLVQLLAHEMSHCLQFNRYGLFKSNPVAGYPFWKWEGYPEYIARQDPGQRDLRYNIKRLLTSKNPNDRWMWNSDGSRTSRAYYNNWLLVQYIVDIRKMDYGQLLRNTVGEDQWRREMMSWYHQKE